MTPVTKFILDELAEARVTANLALKYSLEILVLLKEKSFVNREDLLKFKKKIES